MFFLKSKITAVSFLITSFLDFKNVVLATTSYDKINSPNILAGKCKKLLNGKTTISDDMGTFILSQSDLENMKAVECYPKLPKKFKNDEIFAVIIDHFKGPIEYVKCVKEEGDNFDDRTFSLKFTFTLPYYSDLFSVHFYKQNKNDPQFLIRKENFIAKMQCDLSGSNICYDGKKYESVLKSFDKNGNVIKGQTANFIKLNTPNFYEIDAANFYEGVDYNLIGLIVLNEKQKDLLSFQEKVVNVGIYDCMKNDFFIKIFYGFSFYLPPEVDEFEFYVYKDEIKEENFKYKHKIKLQKN